MGINTASLLTFEKLDILVPVCFGTRLGASKNIRKHLDMGSRASRPGRPKKFQKSENTDSKSTSLSRF